MFKTNWNDVKVREKKTISNKVARRKRLFNVYR